MKVQCARVDAWPTITGHRGLPTVNDLSVTSACCNCRQQVWVSRPTWAVARTDKTLVVICNVCQPALPVHVTHEPKP